MTNNPLKINGLIDNGIHVHQRLEHIAGISNFNSQYLATKGARMGHLLDLD
jgi:GTP cyclohydrolase II